MSLDRMKPFAYQEEDIKSILAAGSTALVVSAVGGRKTLTAVEVGVRNKSKSVLVVAPQNTLEDTWEATIKRQDPTAVVKQLSSTVKGRKFFDELVWDEAEGWYLCSIQWFARQNWVGIEPDMVIFDEVHTACNYSNITRAKLHQLIPIKQKLALSGTPLRNKFENAWALIRFLWPELMPKTFWAWRRSDCAGKYDRFAQQNWKVTGEKVPGKLMNSLPCYIQHLARQNCCSFHPNGFLADLKEPLVIERVVELSTAQKKFYRQMEENYVAWLTTPDENGKLPVVAELPIVARGMLRTCTLGLPSLDLETGKLYFETGCTSTKIDDPTDGLLAVLEEIDKQPALVYLHDKRFTKEIVDRLNKKGYRAVEWSGDVSKTARKQIKAQFITGEWDVVVAVISAIGTGTDGIQNATNVEVWLSESDDPTDNEQGRGRLDRPGQENQVLRIYIRARDTMDYGIASNQLQAALKMNKQLRKTRK